MANDLVKRMVKKDGSQRISFYCEEYAENPRHNTDEPFHCEDWSRDYSIMNKQEQIQKCIERGVEGYRDLWRLHYMDIYGAESQSASEHFFYGGNVLLRFSINKDKIESSKSICMTIATAKAMWKIISKWHENPASFKKMQIKTLSGTYTIVSYKNDILTAGCHSIAYAEMEHMYNEIIANENAA